MKRALGLAQANLQYPSKLEDKSRNVHCHNNGLLTRNNLRRVGSACGIVASRRVASACFRVIKWYISNAPVRTSTRIAHELVITRYVNKIKIAGVGTLKHCTCLKWQSRDAEMKYDVNVNCAY